MIRCGFIGLVGLPNAGKSSFLNYILGEDLTIVTEKPQTTRQSMSGLLTTDDHQMIFFDAPGFVEPKQGLFRFLASEFDRVIEKSDQLLFLIGHDQKESKVFQKAWDRVKDSGKPYQVVFSKSDLPESSYVTSLKSEVQKMAVPAADLSVKAKEKEKLDVFLKKLSLQLPEEHHPLYDPDMISLDRTRDIVSEFIREACFANLKQEIPFGLAVVIKSFKREKGLRHIQANILVEKDNHKSIVIGKGGEQLKRIGQLARKRIEKLLDEKIFLGLHVSFKKNWQKNSGIMKELGYFHESD